MTIESFLSMASSATALVKSTVKRTEFICLRTGSKGASRRTVARMVSGLAHGYYDRVRSRHTAGVVEALVCESLRISGRSRQHTIHASGQGSRGLAVSRAGAFGYSQSPHRGHDRPGIGRRAGLGTHRVGGEADGFVHVVISKRGVYIPVFTPFTN